MQLSCRQRVLAAHFWMSFVMGREGCELCSPVPCTTTMAEDAGQHRAFWEVLSTKYLNLAMGKRLHLENNCREGKVANSI